MAYEISSSLGPSGAANIQVVNAEHSSAAWKGGAINPAGTQIAVPSKRHLGSSDSVENRGIEILASGSSGFTKSDSIDTGTSLIYWIKWKSDSEFYAAHSTGDVYNYVSSSSGWAQGSEQIDLLTSDVAFHGYFNHDFTQLAATEWYNPGQASGMADADRTYFFESGSSGWSSKGNYQGSGKVTAVTWIDDDTAMIGQPAPFTTYNAYTVGEDGLIEVVTHNGSSWSRLERVEGRQDSTYPYGGLGAGLYYHTASNSTIMSTIDNSGHARFFVMPSGSEGYLPNNIAINDFTEIDVSHLTASGRTYMRVSYGSGWDIDPASGDRLVVASSDDLSTQRDERVYFALESGSDGWKASKAINADSDGVGNERDGFQHSQLSNGGSTYVAFTSGSNTNDSYVTIYDIYTPSTSTETGTSESGGSTVSQAATGSIDFSNLPDNFSMIEIDDGQGTAFSNVKFHAVQYSGNGYDAISGSSAANNVQNGNASGILNLYKQYSTSSPMTYLSWANDTQSNSTYQEFVEGGATPLSYEYTDASGSVVEIKIVSESDFTHNVGSGGSNPVRKDSTGNYSINVYNTGFGAANMAECHKLALEDARTSGDFDISYASRVSTVYLRLAQTAGDGPVSIRVKRLSGTWTETSKAALHVMKDDASNTAHRIANIYTPDEVVYSIRNAPTGGSGTLSAAAYASYFADMVNDLPLAITATVSDTTVSLTNDTVGSAGNVEITTTGTTNTTILGMDGGSGGSQSGGSSEMAQKRMTISAKQMELKASGGLSGSADNKAALVLDLDGLASTASLAQDDVLAMHSSGDAAPKKVSFSDLEDAMFANISGDATVAAGGDLTISSLAVENSMLSGGIENSKLVNDSVTVVAGDALTGGGEVDLGASITLDVAVDDSSLEVSSDALQVKALGITNAMLAGSIASSKIAELNSFDTDDLSEGSSNQYFTQARARGSISVTDAGGDGSMSYDSSTGVITFTGPSASEVRAHFSGGTGVTITDGEVAIGQSVATSDNVQFADLVLTGDLTVGGTTTTVNSTEVAIVDKAIVLGSGSTDSQVAAASGAGLKIGDEDSPLATFLYDGVDSWDLSDHLNLASGQHLAIADANMLDADGAAKVRSAVAGDGLGHSAGLLSVNVDDSSIEIDSDSLQVKALGITNAMLAGSIESSKLAELSGSFDTDDLPEGSSNEYFTQARARGSISVTDAGGDGSLSYDSSTGVITFTGPSASEVRGHFSAVDAGGDGSFSYDSSTGAFTYTGPSASEVRAHFSGGEMIDFASGEFSINASEFSGSWDAALATKDTDDLAEGDNLYFTQARARASVSVTDAGGDGSLSYNSSTGVITYTGPSAAEVRAHFSGGDGIDLTAGAISVNVDDSGIEIVSDELKLKDSGVVTAKIADDAVTAAKIADDIAGDGMQIADGVLSISQAQEVFASSDLSANAATLSGTPASDEAVFVFMNGLLLAEGSSRDYTISGQVITLASENAMQSEDELVVKYINQ